MNVCDKLFQHWDKSHVEIISIPIFSKLPFIFILSILFWLYRRCFWVLPVERSLACDPDSIWTWPAIGGSDWLGAESWVNSRAYHYVLQNPRFRCRCAWPTQCSAACPVIRSSHCLLWLQDATAHADIRKVSPSISFMGAFGRCISIAEDLKTIGAGVRGNKTASCKADISPGLRHPSSAWYETISVGIILLVWWYTRVSKVIVLFIALFSTVRSHGYWSLMLSNTEMHTAPLRGRNYV